MKSLKPDFIELSPEKRLYGLEKPIVALTGGIATGKSTVTKILEKKGFSVIDADLLIKKIYQKNETKEFIKLNYPAVWQNNEINFKDLRQLFFKDQKIKAKIEAFLYIHLSASFKEEAARIQSQNFFIYDVPLLFEKELQSKVDVSVLVYAPRTIQRARLIDRDGHVEVMANTILDSQIDIEEKKIKADFIIDNSNTLVELVAEVELFLNQILL